MYRAATVGRQALLRGCFFVGGGGNDRGNSRCPLNMGHIREVEAAVEEMARRPLSRKDR